MLKNTSGFRYQDEHIKISYLCTFMDKDILNAIEYRSFTEEKTLLDANLDYIRKRLHPTQIKQLNVLKAHIEGGQKTCNFLVNICQDFCDSAMKENDWKQWLILIYLTKIKDETLLNEVIKRLTK